MTSKSRYFLVGASAALLIGLTAGLVAYFGYSARQIADPGLPAELRLVPSDAEVVAYANVSAVMNSDLRRELEALAGHGPQGKRPMHEVVGIDLEKQVSHLVAYLDRADDKSVAPSQMLLLARGTFDQARIEEFLIQHGGTAEDYHSKRIVTRQKDERHGDVAVGFVEPGLVALGRADLVRRALDQSTAGSSATAGSIATNTELMDLIRNASGSTAWVVGRFDAMTRGVGMSERLSKQVPPLRLVSAKAHINGGLKATLRAETADQAAADQLREVVRGFVSILRLQGGSKPELQTALKTVELSGTGSTVQMSFALTPETFRAIAPPRRPRPDPQPEPR